MGEDSAECGRNSSTCASVFEIWSKANNVGVNALGKSELYT